MDPRWLDSIFMLRFFESLMWLMAWVVAAVCAVEFLIVVILALGRDKRTKRA